MTRALALLALCGACAHAQQWTSVGPSRTTGFGGATGRVSAVACSRSDANVIFIGGADGGVWKTTDGGASWRSLTDHLITAIGAIALQPGNDSVIYAGSGEANFANHSRPGDGVYKSTDGGESWTVLGRDSFAGRCISRIATHPSDPARLLVGVTGAGGFPFLAAAKNHPQATGPRGLWKSTDAGASWTRDLQVPNADVTDVLGLPATPSTIIAAVGAIAGGATNGIWRSTDNGSTWSQISAGLPASALMGRIGLAASPARPGRVYAFIARPCDATGAGASTRGIYRSDDAGLTWILTSTISAQATYGWYFATIAAHPTAPDEVWIGGLESFRSTNAGLNFSSTAVPHPDVHAHEWDIAGRLISGDDGGVHRYSGGGWSSLNNGLTLTQCYAGISTDPADPERIIVGLQDNGTALRRAGSGSVWTHVNGGDGGWTQINQQLPTEVFAEYQGTGTLSRSTDGGLTFFGAGGGLTGRNCFLPPYLLDPGPQWRMLYATERLWLSTDQGASFTPLSPDLTGGGSAAIRTLAIAPSSPLYVYVVTNDGRVLASSNGGATFTLSITGHPGWPRVTRELFVRPDDPRAVYLAAAGYGSNHVLFTPDAGATWSVLGAGLPDVPVNTVCADIRTTPPRVFAGTEIGVWVLRQDGGWEPYGVGMPRVPTIDLLIEPARNRLLAATQGRGVFSIPLCRADFTNDGGVDGDDIIAFFAAWDVNDPRADITSDGGVDGDDVITFFANWDAGC